MSKEDLSTAEKDIRIVIKGIGFIVAIFITITTISGYVWFYCRAKDNWDHVKPILVNLIDRENIMNIVLYMLILYLVVTVGLVILVHFNLNPDKHKKAYIMVALFVPVIYLAILFIIFLVIGYASAVELTNGYISILAVSLLGITILVAGMQFMISILKKKYFGANK